MEISGIWRGLGLRLGSLDLVGEGVGIGGLVARKGGVTYFPLHCTDNASGDTLSRLFQLNGVSKKYIGPLDVTMLHRTLRDYLAPHYLAGSNLSKLFRLLMILRGQLVKTRYRRVDSIGSVEVRYRFLDDYILVSLTRVEGSCGIIVANEFSGRIFDRMVIHGRMIVPPPWARCHSNRVTLISSFLPAAITVELPPGYEVYVGREVLPPRLDWAGVDIFMPEESKNISYKITVSRELYTESSDNTISHLPPDNRDWKHSE